MSLSSSQFLGRTELYYLTLRWTYYFSVDLAGDGSDALSQLFGMNSFDHKT